MKESAETLDKLVEAKVKIHENKRLLEEKVEKLKNQCVLHYA